jgi:anti-anti-sigma regulatory factor
MAVRITSHQDPNGFVLCVEGILDGTASELMRAEAGRAPAGSLVLNLSGLVAFDEGGLAALRALADSGARIEGASRYVQVRLAADLQGDPRRAPHRSQRTRSPSPDTNTTEEKE